MEINWEVPLGYQFLNAAGYELIWGFPNDLGSSIVEVEMKSGQEWAEYEADLAEAQKREPENIRYMHPGHAPRYM